MSTGLIGRHDLDAATDTLVGGAAVDEAMVVNVYFCNRSSTTATNIRLAISANGSSSPAAADYLEYDMSIPAGGGLERTGIAVSTGEKIFVRSSQANVSVRASGLPVN